MLEDGKYAMIGVYQGIVTSGSSNNKYIVFGADYSDVIYGYNANTVRGEGGASDNDDLYGYGGDDILDGGAGTNVLFGGEGMDVSSYATASAGVSVDFNLTYGSVDDDHSQYVKVMHTYYDPMQGKDIEGIDNLYEIEGIISAEYSEIMIRNNDSNYFLDGRGNDYFEGRSGCDTIYGGDGDDTLRGGNGNDILYGGTGDDVLKGGYGNDTLRGDDGDDVLYATDGKSVLDGGAGADTLIAEGGKNKLTGGKGADTFLIKDGENQIMDFSKNQGDKIVFDVAEIFEDGEFTDWEFGFVKGHNALARVTLRGVDDDDDLVYSTDIIFDTRTTFTADDILLV